MVEERFNTLRFLDQPYEVRKLVYYHLDGQYTNANPPALDALYHGAIEIPNVRDYGGSKKVKKYYRQLVKKLYPLFEQYLQNFQYSPAMIESWLEYSLWLRYDAIVLDSLRLNHLYDGELVGPLDWIEIDGDLRLAVINKLYMLQVWYSYGEYKRWVIRNNITDYGDMEVGYLRLNLEMQRDGQIPNIIQKLRKKEQLNLISEINFTTNIDTVTNGNANGNVKRGTNLKRARSDSPDVYLEDPMVKERYQIPNDPALTETIVNLEEMKQVSSLSVRGKNLYESLINVHGARDNPGRTISYISRRRVMRIAMNQVLNPSETGLADLTKWVNLRVISINDCGFIDLNKLILPSKAISLSLSNIRELRWWEFEMDSAIQAQFQQNKLLPYRPLFDLCEAGIHYTLDKKSISLVELKKFQTTIWKKLQALNWIKINNVAMISNKFIVIPKTLYESKRTVIFSTTVHSNIVVI